MLFLYEIKKLYHQKMIMFSILAVVVLSVLLMFFEINHHGYYTAQGQYKTGIIAAKNLCQERETLNGKMSDSLVQTVAKKYHVLQDSRNQKGLSMEEMEHSWQRYRPLAEVLMRAYASLSNGDEESFAQCDPADVHARDIMRGRVHQLSIQKEMVKADGTARFREQEKRYIANAKLPSTSSLLYEDATSWGILFENIRIINLALCVIAALIGASLFSREVQIKSTSLLYTTKRGRKSHIACKFLASIASISIITILMHCLYAGLIFSVYSISGAMSFIQFQSTYWLSLFSFTNTQAYIFIIGLGFAGSLTTLFVSILFSRFTKKEYHSLIFSLLFLFLPMIIHHTTVVFPSDMCEGNLQLINLSFYEVGNQSLYAYQIQVLVAIASSMLLVLIYCSFRRRNIRMLW